LIDVDDEEGFVEHRDIPDTTTQDIYRAYRLKFPMNKEFVHFLILK
jgi:hypothetical protein